SIGERRSARFTTLQCEPTAGAFPDNALAAAIEEELALLPESYRAAVVLCYFEGKSQREAALLLATTIDAINSRLKRARELLREGLARHGLVCTAAALATALTVGSVQAALAPVLIA